jgi:long-chain acyl-CoA synthetase
MFESIGQIPVEAAKMFGDKTALVVPNRTMSFDELDAMSNRCAKALVNLGVEAGDRVTLYSSNCWEWVVSYYGALRAGAAINPINVMLTSAEVEFVANDCGASVVIASHEKALSLQGVKEKSKVRDIITFCREYLAAYKVPRAVQFVDDLLRPAPAK